MNNTISPTSGGRMTVLEVNSVLVNSGRGTKTVDDTSSTVLHEAGFEGVRFSVGSKNTTGRWTDNNGKKCILELDHSKKTSRLLFLQNGSVGEIDVGEITFHAPATSSGVVNIGIKGKNLDRWQLFCQEVDEETAKEYRERISKGHAPVGPFPPPVPIPSPITPTTPIVEPASVSVEEEERVLLIPVDEILPFQKQENAPAFSGQPRKDFSEKALKKLADSIKKHKQTVPALVKRYTGPIAGIKWELIAGERRWRAVRIAGIPYLRALEKKPKDKKEQHMMALIENFHRANQNPIETSNALQEQIDAGETQATLAEQTSLSVTQIRKLLSIQTLHGDLKPFLVSDTPNTERIRLSEAAALGRIQAERQIEIWTEAKKQPTRRLVSAKIFELGHPFIIYKRVDRKARRNEAGRTTERIQRRINTLNLNLIELKALSPSDWGKFAALRGVEKVASDLSFLNEAIREMEEIKGRLYRAKTSLKSSLQEAA